MHANIPWILKGNRFPLTLIKSMQEIVPLIISFKLVVATASSQSEVCQSAWGIERFYSFQCWFVCDSHCNTILQDTVHNCKSKILNDVAHQQTFLGLSISSLYASQESRLCNWISYKSRIRESCWCHSSDPEKKSFSLSLASSMVALLELRQFHTWLEAKQPLCSHLIWLVYCQVFSHHQVWETYILPMAVVLKTKGSD